MERVTNKIHFNSEFVCGFVEAMIELMDYGVGSFKRDLAGYAIKFERVNDPQGEHKVIIEYQVVEDKRELKVHFFLKEFNREHPATTLNEFRHKCEVVVEEIINETYLFRKQ